MCTCVRAAMYRNLNINSCISVYIYILYVNVYIKIYMSIYIYINRFPEDVSPGHKSWYIYIYIHINSKDRSPGKYT